MIKLDMARHISNYHLELSQLWRCLVSWCTQWPGAALDKVISGRDSRSVRVLVPDVKVLDRGFHVVMLLDMGDVEGPDVPVADLSLLRLLWPLPVVSGMAR